MLLIGHFSARQFLNIIILLLSLSALNTLLKFRIWGSSVKDWKWKNLFEENQAYDKTVKVLLVDEEEYLKRMNQKEYEISKKEGTGKGALVAFDLKGNVKACQEKNEMGYTLVVQLKGV